MKPGRFCPLCTRYPHHSLCQSWTVHQQGFGSVTARFLHTAAETNISSASGPTSQLDFFREITPVSLSSLLRRNPLTWHKRVGILLPRSSGSRMTFLRGWAQRKAATAQTVWSAAAPQDAFQRENVTHRRFLNYNEVGSGKRGRLEDG